MSKRYVDDFLREGLDGPLNPHEFLLELLFASLSRLSAVRNGHPLEHVRQVPLRTLQVLQRRYPLLVTHQSSARRDLLFLLHSLQSLDSLIRFMLVLVETVNLNF